MTSSLLTDLRERVIDESEPLPGLLRKCLMLGAETGSQSLREWARFELNGYPDEAEVPSYRRIHAGMTISYVSGYNQVSGQSWSWYNLPAKAREIVPEQLTLRSPLAEIERMADQKFVQFGSGRLSTALQILNDTLPYGQAAHELAYSVPGATLTGIVDRIRTSLVELVADLTADTPTGERPSGSAVEAAVKEHVGITYITHVHAPSGPVAVGEGAHAQGTVENLSRALADLRAMAEREGEQEITEAIDDLQQALEEERPAAGPVTEKVSRLRRLAANVGSAALGSAVTGVAETATAMAFGGVFA
ncbi:hypothetical protein AB0E52_11485 [Micrococcus luteus]|uniref:AbiTii domain-containing protein n=1 Tax=Actinomycetes TaxID=1760 RepID=UPI002A66C73C|nr:hypothetical protein [Micrococcus luteus]